MTLYGAVQTYIDGKHACNVVFEEAAKILRSFSKKVGDVSLDTITPAHILDFLNGPRTSYGTWCVKFGLLKFFFEYWMARGLVDRSPMPPLKSPYFFVGKDGKGDDHGLPKSLPVLDVKPLNRK